MDDDPVCAECGHEINRSVEGYTVDNETGVYLCDLCDPDPDEDEYAEYLGGQENKA